MSTWSLTGLDMTAGLAVTSYVVDRYLWALVFSPRAALSVHLDEFGQAPDGL